jgi:hypothetical protein
VVKHIQGGLEIVSEYRQHVFSGSEQNLIPSKHLIQAFARLERQLCEVIEKPKVVLELIKTQTSNGVYECSVLRPPRGAHFETFDDAWRALDLRWHAMHSWLAKLQNLAADDFVPSEFLNQRAGLLNDFSDWKISFEKSKMVKNASLTQRERCISVFLDCHMVLARLILDIATESGEMRWDRHVENFKQVLEFCCDVVAAESSFPIASNCLSTRTTSMDDGRRKVAQVMIGQRYIPQEGTKLPSDGAGVLLFLDMGILPILFHVIRYCRNARIRLRAINFLEQNPRLEGLWNSHMLARLARSLDAIERRGHYLEEAAMRDAPAHEIPCESRISNLDISFGGTREAYITFHKPGVDVGAHNIQIRETITW